MSLKNRLTVKYLALRYKLGPKYRKSYSQCGEDIILARVLKSMGIIKPFYIDLGTNDPIVYNNTYLFYKSGSNGICVEPNPRLARKIRAIRPRDICVNVGVGRKSGKETFFIFKNDALSTFSSLEAENAIKQGVPLLSKNETPIQTLEEITKTHTTQPVDLLSIDIEGLDYEVLSSVDFNKFKPRVICVEIKSFAQENRDDSESQTLKLLTLNGYIKVAETPINAIFIDSSLKRKE